MKKIKSLIIILLLSYNVIGQTQPQQQEKKYSAFLTILDWDTLLQSLNSTDDVALNSRKRIYADILSQIQHQIAYEKHIQDSLANIKPKK